MGIVLPGVVVSVALTMASMSSAQSLSGNYTPSYVSCPPNTPLVRPAVGLAANETAWLSKRRNNIRKALKDYLDNVDIPEFNVGDYLQTIKNNDSDVPVIGFTFSGGGTRAELAGFGIYQGLFTDDSHFEC